MPHRLPWLLPLVALALAAPALWQASPLAVPEAGEEATRRALAQGNRLVRDGELESAVGAYAAGWGEGAAADVAGVLAYNLGTTLHRLGREPEALLWYRSAEPLRPGDRWLAANLALVRGELAAPRRPPPGAAARLVAWRLPLTTGAVVAAWATLALLALRRPIERATGGRRRAARTAGGSAVVLAVLSLLLWVAPAAAAVVAARPAVLLAPCGGAAEDGAGAGGGAADPLPPGSEIWVRPGEGGWRLAGEPGGLCPGAAVGIVGAPGEP